MTLENLTRQATGREPFIHVSDVDINDKEYGNLTLTIDIGPGSGFFGTFSMSEIVPEVELFQYYRPASKTQTLRIKGRIEAINVLMTRIYFNSESDRTGYAPFVVKASDNNNYGECSGAHFCGTDEPCDDGRDSDPHRKSQAAEGKKQIDVIIGTKVRCQHVDCNDCNIEAGCGWCPATCADVGKCMMGGSKPLYETCPVSSDGRSYKQCDKMDPPIVMMAAVITVAVLVMLVLGYYFKHFAERRHGGILPYVTTKLLSTRRFLRRLNMYPPDEANYPQFFAMIALVIVAFLVNSILQPGIAADCVYHTDVFLDNAVKVNLYLDKCVVRFLPARKLNWKKERDYGTPSLKVKVAYSVKQDIVFEAQTCEAEAVISITNSLPVDIKYVGYYCNIALLVPDNYIVPSTYIQDNNGFSTQVRSGAMDQDSEDFAIDFGPNSFQMEGAVINARMRGVKARFFKFHAVAGSLYIELLQTGLDGAQFSSVSADMIVTTPDRTSVRFWQRDDNKVCLTAAKNSLYVDGNCKRMCAFLPAKAVPDEVAEFVTPTTEEECISETVAGEWDSLVDPPVCNLRCKSLVRPLIPGCYNMAACILLETNQCLCKPSCDLVSPSLLDYDGFSGVQGTCNDAGQCCRVICAGFSVADMHPEPDMPRDGSMRSEDKYFENKLDQSWTFESDSGQLAFRVGSAKDRHHSYQGGVPVDYIESKIGLVNGDKDTLDYLFHPGGDNAPKQELFAAGLTGPGTPEEANGQFLWLSKPLYLILPKWMLEILSFGLLTPTKLESKSNLNPAFCPVEAAEGSPEFNKRMVLMYKALTDTFRNWPIGQLPKNLPSGSLLVYKPVSAQNASLVFRADSTSGQILVTQFNIAEYPLITAMLVVGLAIPMFVSTFAILVCIVNFRVHLFTFRRVRLMGDAVMSKGITVQQEFDHLIDQSQTALRKARENLKKETGDIDKLKAKIEFLQTEKDDLHRQRDNNREESEEVSQEAVQHMVAMTNFFYMYENFVQDPEEMRSIQTLFALVLQQVLAAYSTTFLPLYVLSLYNTTWLSDNCEFRPDRCSCLNEPSSIGVAINIMVSLHWILSAVELGLYYLQIPYNTTRKLIRVFFYISLTLFMWLTMTIIVLLCAWTFLGFTINALKAGPFVIAGVGIILYIMFTFVKKTTFQTRVTRALIKGVELRKGILSKDLPDNVLDIMMNKNITRALKANGLSFPSIVLASIFSGVLLSVVFLFLFIGFSAFSDPKNPVAGMLNTVLTLVVSLVALQMGRAVDVEEMHENVERLEQDIMIDIQDTIHAVVHQVEQASKLISQMRVCVCV